MTKVPVKLRSGGGGGEGGATGGANSPTSTHTLVPVLGHMKVASHAG